MRVLLLLLAAVLAAAPAGAQRRAESPRRPQLPVGADTNSADAYFRLGRDLVGVRPRQAADAFWWASQIDPASADALYGRYAALLLTDPERLARYFVWDPRTRSHPQVMAIDSLYRRALRLDPFLRPQFERDLVVMFMAVLFSRGRDVRATLAVMNPEVLLREAPPGMRGRLLAADGRVVEALRAYDEALRRSERRGSEPAGFLRQERARLFALAGNDSMALVELRHALDAAAEEEEGDELVYFSPETRASLEYSLGLIQERAGDVDAARETYLRALVADLSYAPAHVRLGALALAQGDTATVARELATAAEVDPDDAPTRLAHATVLAALSRLPEAEAELVAATRLAPHYADPWILLGSVRGWRGEGDAVAAYGGFLQRARADDPRRGPVEAAVAAAQAPAPRP